MPNLPPGLGICNFYFDAQNGLQMYGSEVEEWADQSGYQWTEGGFGPYSNAFRGQGSASTPELIVSTRVALNTGLAARYLQFVDAEKLTAGTQGLGGTPNLPFPGTHMQGVRTVHPFHDLYFIACIEGTEQHPNNCWLMLQGDFGGVSPNYVIHGITNGQSPSGISLRASISGGGGGYAQYHLPVGQVGVETWKIYCVKFSRTNVSIYQGTTLKHSQTLNMSTMPVGKWGHIGGNEYPNVASGEGRSIMFMAAFGSNSANHTSTQRADMVEYLTSMYSQGTGGGSNLL